MVKFMDLPDVVLLLILEKLPIWNALQLGRLCHRLNHLKRVCFNTRITSLRLYVGSTVNKIVFDHKMSDFFHLHGDYDLIIRFASQKIVSSSSSSTSLSIYSNITLNEDLLVKSADQIGCLAQLFPKITSLTVTIYGTHDYPNCCVSLLACWPKLNSLKILNQSPSLDFMKHTKPAINSLGHLEHLQLDLGHNIKHPERNFGALYGKLKTFIIPDIINGKYIFGTSDDNPSAWNGENAMVQTLERGLDTFGLSRYRYYNQPDLTNPALIRKLKHLQARLDIINSPESLAQWNLTHWTALQCLHLDFRCKSANSSFRPLLKHLSPLTNLTEFQLILESPKYEYLSEEACQNLPRLDSVRRFQVKCLLEPHQLHLLANAFPNASDELSLRLPTTFSKSSDDSANYLDRRPHLSALCGECKENMKQAIDKFGDNIASFHWFLEQGQQQGTSELIPKVKLFTTEIAGRIRPNYDCIPY